VLGAIRHGGGTTVGWLGLPRGADVGVGISRGIGFSPKKAHDPIHPFPDTTILRAPHDRTPSCHRMIFRSRHRAIFVRRPAVGGSVHFNRSRYSWLIQPKKLLHD